MRCPTCVALALVCGLAACQPTTVVVLPTEGTDGAVPPADGSVDPPADAEPPPLDGSGGPDAQTPVVDAGTADAWTPDATMPPGPGPTPCASGSTRSPGDGAGTLFHVRTDGDDAACDGTADRAAGGGARRCAFRTPQRAVDAISPGDDVVIHAGTHPPFELRGSAGGAPTFAASSGNRTIIEGDPRRCPEDVVIDARGAPHGVRSAGGRGSSSRTRFVTVRNLRVRGGTDAPVELGPEHEESVLEGLLIDDLGGLSGRHASGMRDAAIRVWSGSRRITIQDSRLLGPSRRADASAIQLYASDSTVRRVHAERFMGNFVFVSSAPNNVFEQNTIVDFACDSDDGCFQVYNNPNTIIRHNLVVRTTPINDFMGVVGIRRTSTSTRMSSVQIYGNTFIGDPRVNPGLRRRTVVVHPTAIGDVSVHDNIFVGYGNATVSGGGAITVRECPSSLSIDHNLYFDNAVDVALPAGGCASATGSPFDRNSVPGDPFLDPVTWEPRRGSPACGAGTGGVDIGALACP